MALNSIIIIGALTPSIGINPSSKRRVGIYAYKTLNAV